MHVNISQIACYPNYNKIYECLVPLCRKEIISSIMDFNNPKNNLNILICNENVKLIYLQISQCFALKKAAEIMRAAFLSGFASLV